MAAEYIEKIRSLADACDGRDTVLYFPDFAAEPAPDSLHQVGGAPIGVGDDWPRSEHVPATAKQSGTTTDDERMEHVFTIDLRGLELPGAPAEARALQLYLTASGYHEAWERGSEHSRVVFLDEAAVARGRASGELPAQTGQVEPRRFSLVRVEVPGAVFSTEPDDETPLGRLRAAIYQAPARLGGEPIWLQGDESESYDDGDEYADDEDTEDAGDDGDGRAALGLQGVPDVFVMQFDEAFANVNLGDCGIMYVYGQDAWFQCH